MSSADQLVRKLQLHVETDFIDIKDDGDDLLELAKEAATEYDDLEKEKDDLVDEIKAKDDEIGKLEDRIEEPEEGVTSEWGLLGEQIKGEFDDIMTNPKCNQIRSLEALRSYNATISANKFKSAAL